MDIEGIIAGIIKEPLWTSIILFLTFGLTLAGFYLKGFFTEKGKIRAAKKEGDFVGKSFINAPFGEVWEKTDEDSKEHLIKTITGASERITIFGLTRNFYMSEQISSLIAAKAQQIPVIFFMMDPLCESRKDRYRIEPTEASLEDPKRYIREIEGPFKDLLKKASGTEAGSSKPGIAVYYYNFPCSFAIEEFDDEMRVMLYGHAKRGTEGPIFTVPKDSKLYGYFSSQLRWLERLVQENVHEPWRSKGISIRKLSGA